MLRLFKLRVVYPHGENTFWLAYVEVTQPANGGMSESASQLVRIVKQSSVNAYAVISAGTIVGVAYLIPEEPFWSKLENRGWIVNTHIDQANWNNIYYMLEDMLNTAVKRV
jgi:glucokinase